MYKTILLYTGIFTLFLISGYLYRKYALSKRILDLPTERSSHFTPVVRGGGIIFVIAVVLSFILNLNYFLSKSQLAFLLGFFILAAIGFLDDRKNLSPWLRFPVQFFAVFFILQAAELWQSDFPVSIKLLGFIVAIGFVNAFNFMDGINGITGLYAGVVLFTFWWINRKVDLIPGSFFEIMFIAIIAFGYFNFRKKALMFAGDIGSMSLAAVLLWIITKFMVELQSPVLLLTVSFYGIDSAMTIIFRLLKRQNIFQAHRWHVYQKWVDRCQISHMKVAAIYALAQAMLNVWIISGRLWERPVGNQISILSSVLIIFVLLYIWHQKEKLKDWH